MLVQTKQVCIISFDTNLYEINIPLKGISRGNSKKGCTCIRRIWKGFFYNTTLANNEPIDVLIFEANPSPMYSQRLNRTIASRTSLAKL